MIVRNRILAFVYRLLATLVAILSLFICFENDAINSVPWNSARYFGTLVTIFSAIIFLLESIVAGKGLKKANKNTYPAIFGQLLFVMVALEVGLALSHPLYFAYLNIGNPHAAYFPSDRKLNQILMYIVLPLISFLDWLIFSEKGNWKYHWLVYLGSIPFFYAMYSFINHYVRTTTTFATMIFDNSTFLNQGFLSLWNGWLGVIVSSMSILLVYLLIGYFLVFLSAVLGGKYLAKPKKKPSLSEL